MTCDGMIEDIRRPDVKRSHSCRITRPSAETTRKISAVHFNPVTRAEVENQSMEALSAEDLLDRQRNFESSKKGRIINRGDSFRRERRTARVRKEDIHRALINEDSGAEGPDLLLLGPISVPADALRSPEVTETHSVLVMGATGVGKSAISRQFQTSEYRTEDDPAQDVEDDTSTLVPVCLDGVEADLLVTEFTCSPTELPSEAQLQNEDAFIIVYSVAVPTSFSLARKLCTCLFNMNVNRPVILVANKCDLVRLRKVSTKEGRALAVQFGYKYVETSVVINSNIDQLLAGVVAQSRLYRQAESAITTCSTVTDVVAASRHHRSGSGRWRREKRVKSRTLPSSIVKDIFQRFLSQPETKSCQNLLVP